MDLDRLRIIKYPDPRLRKRSDPVSEITPDLPDLTARMFELMYEVRGLGLAAAQVGINLRFFVTNHTGEEADERVYINPEFLDLSGTTERDEGCLSLPELYVPLKRAQRCRIRAMDLQGNAFEEEAEDLLARAWQHEIDHIDGRLIIDYMTPTQKIANRRLLKKLEQEYKQERKGSVTR